MQRIYTRAVIGNEFYNLMKQAGLSRNNLIRLTGLDGIDIESIIKGTKRPRMADLVILRAVAAMPDILDNLLSISGEYIEDRINTSTARAERRAKQFGHGHD